MKRTIRLRESELKRIISESVKSVLKENNNQPIDYELMAYFDQLSNDLSVIDANLKDAGFNGNLTQIKNAADILIDALSPYSDIHQRKQHFDRRGGNEGSGFGSNGIGYF